MSLPRLSQDVIDYWTNQGISLLLSGEIIEVAEGIRAGRIEARISSNTHRPIHAKIYRADDAVTVGSSNFSRSGMELQIEANTRFTRAEERRFEEATQLAEHIWEGGRQFTADLLDLLGLLLHRVSWEEALARACGEVLEGSWAT